MPHTPQPDDGAVKLPRVSIDFKIPLPWLIGGAAFIVTGLVSMYYQQLQIAENVMELKTSMKTTNAMTTQLVTDQAIMKYRLEKLEHDKQQGERR